MLCADTISKTPQTGVPPYYMVVSVALWDRCTAFCSLPPTPGAPCLPALYRRLGTRQMHVQFGFITGIYVFFLARVSTS